MCNLCNFSGFHKVLLFAAVSVFLDKKFLAFQLNKKSYLKLRFSLDFSFIVPFSVS